MAWRKVNVFIYTVGKQAQLKLYDVFVIKKNIYIYNKETLISPRISRATKKHKLVIQIYHVRTKIRKAVAKARIMRKKVFIVFLWRIYKSWGHLSPHKRERAPPCFSSYIPQLKQIKASCAALLYGYPCVQYKSSLIFHITMSFITMSLQIPHPKKFRNLFLKFPLKISYFSLIFNNILKFFVFLSWFRNR